MYLGESALATNWHRKISQRNLLRVKKPSSIIKVGNAYNISRCWRCYLEKSNGFNLAWNFWIFYVEIYRLQAVHMSFGRLFTKITTMSDSCLTQVTTQTVLFWRQKWTILRQWNSRKRSQHCFNNLLT